MRAAARLGIIAAIAWLTAASYPAAYLKLGTRTSAGVIGVSFPQPIHYFIKNLNIANVTAGDLQAAAAAAFATWAAVPTVSLGAQFEGFTTAEPGTADGIFVIGFQNRPDLDHTLGATTFDSDQSTGRLLAADIFLNSAFDWSVAPAGSSGRFDVQSILTHEEGHVLGLSHSLLGETDLVAGGRRVIAKEAVMFPIAYPSGTTLDRAIRKDDMAGITDLYGTTAVLSTLGQVTGRVTLNGQGLFGAHVTASSLATGAIVGGFALDSSGTFVIGALEPGLYVLRAEPLDDGDITSFFDSSAVINVNFKPTFYSKIVAVPAGGAGKAVEIKVQAK